VKILLIQKMAGVAGSETYYLNLLPELVRRGISVDFACVEHPDDADKNDAFCATLVKSDVRCHRFKTRSALPLRVLWRLRRLILRRSISLVQTNLIHADLWGALLKISFFGRLRLVSAKHGYSESYQTAHGFDYSYLEHDLFSVITRFAGFFADRIFCISDGLKGLLVKGRLVSSSKTITIPYGFDFQNMPCKLDVGCGRFGYPQVIVVARLVPVKQHDLLLSCVSRLAANFPDIKFVMIGDGPLKDDLIKKTNELSVSSHVEWLGYRDNVHDYIRDSDVLVLPSAAEGFGLVVLEAWFNLTPVIAFDVPALNEIITHDVNGLLVSPFNKLELENNIKYLLEDSGRAKKMGRDGFQEYRQKYSINALVETTIDLYREVLQAY